MANGKECELRRLIDMIWIVLILVVLCIAMSCAASRYRGEWQFESKMRRLLQEESKVIDNRCLELEMQNKELNDLKTLTEQRYENERKLRMDAELRANELEKKLPKRDSKGRFCKK